MNTSVQNETEEVDFADTLLYFELVIIAVVMSTFCALTIVGNLLVLLSFIFDKKLRTHNNYFLLSLAVSDIMIGTFAMPLFTMYMLIGEWPLGAVLCDMWLAQDYMCCCASGLNLLVIGFDRYFSVISPLRYRARRRCKHVASMISCVWVISFLLWNPWIYSWQYIEGRRTVPQDECYVQFLETNSFLTVITAAIEYYIPVSILCILYFRIWRETVKRKHYLTDMEAANRAIRSCSEIEFKLSEKEYKAYCLAFFSCYSFKVETQNEQNSPKMVEEIELFVANSLSTQNTESEYLSDMTTECNPNNDTEFNSIQNSEELQSVYKQEYVNEKDQFKGTAVNRMHRGPDNKAARVLSAILLAFIVTATPYNILVIIKTFDASHTLVPDALWYFCYFLLYVNSTLNPACYALANVNFRKTYWKLLTCSWRKKSRNEYEFSSSL